MDQAELRRRVLAILSEIAPEIEPEEMVDERPLRHQVDLDSMDWLNFLIALHRQLAVEIPESDYARLVTLRDLLDYLGAKLK